MFSSNNKIQTYFLWRNDKMKTESSNREEEITLKSSRLNMLLMAGEELVNHNYSQANDVLLLFMDTIDSETTAGQEIREAYLHMQLKFNEGVDRVEFIVNKAYDSEFGGAEERAIMEGLPRGTWHDREIVRRKREFARGFNSICWSIAHTHELIPSK